MKLEPLVQEAPHWPHSLSFIITVGVGPQGRGSQAEGPFFRKPPDPWGPPGLGTTSGLGSVELGVSRPEPSQPETLDFTLQKAGT